MTATGPGMNVDAPTGTAIKERTMTQNFTLTLSCPQRPGIVHAVSSFLYARNCDIAEHQQFDETAARPSSCAPRSSAPTTPSTSAQLTDNSVRSRPSSA